MRLLRHIIVFLTCAFFTTASLGSTQMRCCAEIAKQKTAQVQTQKASPCHGEMVKTDAHAEYGKSPPETHKSLFFKSCQCLGTAQVAAIPEPSAPLRIAFDNRVVTAAAALYPDIPAPIDTPPKIIS